MSGPLGHAGEYAAAIALFLLVLNVGVVLFVYWRRLRLAVHEQRAERVRTRLAPIIETVRADASPDDRKRLHDAVSDLDAQSRPLAAALLIDRLDEAAADERSAILELLREAGAIDVALQSARARTAWRRSLACAALGASRAREAVPVLEELLADRNHHVREAAVEALGAIGDPAALPALRQLYLSESGVRPGIVYAALVEFGPAAADVFVEGIGSASPRVRASACFGLAATGRGEGFADEASLEPIERALADAEPAVRTAAADALAIVGQGPVPAELVGLVTDTEPGVRRAAVRALRAYDDPGAVAAGAGALRDDEREVALRAAETLVLLARMPRAGPAAARALAVEDVWTVETARILDAIGAL
ncbi:MAG TPA: HEAT repeat domain-containing protein [Gaiellaceae bacterium]|nr:HEAT repeat domain-containing protein [Gaiellaceae bacterium]